MIPTSTCRRRRRRRNSPTPRNKLLVDWIKEGAEYQPHVVADRAGAPAGAARAGSRRRLLGPQSDRQLRRRQARVRRPEAGARGRSPHARASREPRSHRLAADAAKWWSEFVNDAKPDAYERLVDKLLASPKWGEHRGRYWLDAARYGDTHGIHIDNYREIWSYRDWVINAFNKNMPFDQFTIENLAGDLLPNATLEQKLGSGFNRCNITTSEGGAIDEEYAVLYTRDRVETTSKVWMGLTAGCAVCHDHKFDPLTQKEFYELAAFFNNTTQQADGRQHQRHAAGRHGAA